MPWTTHHFVAIDVGFLPHIFSDDDPRPCVEQAKDKYAHGGGWNSFSGFELKKSLTRMTYLLQYPGDPPMEELARCKIREELVILFESSWVAIVQADGAYDVSRMD